MALSELSRFFSRPLKETYLAAQAFPPSKAEARLILQKVRSVVLLGCLAPIYFWYKPERPKGHPTDEIN